MNWNKAYQRITRKYNPDCMENDEWSDTYIEYKVLGEKIISESNDGSYSKTVTIRTKLDNLTKQIVYDYLVDEYLRGCSCEYDCCGHYFGGIRVVKKINNSKFRITLSYTPNY